MKKLLHSSLFIAAAALAFFFLLAALLGPFLAPHNPVETNIYAVLAPPGGDYPLGTDDLGRCILSRIIYGCRTTLGAALLVEALILVIGTAAGCCAGFLGGVLDGVVVTVIDILLSFPSIILALVIAALLGPGLTNLMIAMTAVYWVEPARIARSVARSLREKEFVTAARASGSGKRRILMLHILPHVLPPILVFGALNTGWIITGISSLSFIGLGVQPPVPEWGAILTEGRAYMQINPLTLMVTILGIVLSIACFQLLGEALRDALNPRTSHLSSRLYGKNDAGRK
ncbi:MAG: ABC transporter permease subunit [Treponema sp.]|jgi:peptide/nickel transport system permease protein|nr:ABC transporter permease subunit [Treponema sp.]